MRKTLPLALILTLSLSGATLAETIVDGIVYPEITELGKPRSVPAQPQFLQISAPIDDGLLDEVDLAMNTRGAAELHALDELTPR